MNNSFSSNLPEESLHENWIYNSDDDIDNISNNFYSEDNRNNIEETVFIGFVDDSDDNKTEIISDDNVDLDDDNGACIDWDEIMKDVSIAPYQSPSPPVDQSPSPAPSPPSEIFNL